MRLLKISGISFLILFISTAVLYASELRQEIDWVPLIFGLCGGLALFLFGMEMMSEGLKKTAGNKMRIVLATLTKNRVIAMFCGAFVTTVIQSSSATTVMLVSFVQASLMSFTQSLGVILGADIGTTITAQMIAFKLTDYAILMIAIGFAIRMIGKDQHIKNIGEAILGFGILFFGMKLMSDAMKPLRTYVEFIELLKGLENPILGLLLGAIMTALIQSSSAFTGIIIVLAQQGLISLEAGIPLVFGANIGTCITAGLASIGTNREAKRVALAHVLFKVAGVMLFIFWIPQFAVFIRWIGNDFEASTARQIANAHTIFNVGLALIFLPFTQYFSRLIMRLLPEDKNAKKLIPMTRYIDESVITTPAIAIDLAKTEVTRMIMLLGRMLEAIICPFTNANCGKKTDSYFPQISLMEGISMREQKLNYLEQRINEYLIQISQQKLDKEQANEIYHMMTIVNEIENIGDVITRNLLLLASRKLTLKKDFSEEGKNEITAYHVKACKQIKRLEEAFTGKNIDLAKKIIRREQKYLDMENEFKAHHLKRYLSEKENTVETHEIHMELMDFLRLIIVHSSHIASMLISPRIPN